MIKGTPSSATITPRIIFVLEVSILCFICIVAILDCLGHLSFSQDSTTYIAAANNFLKTGHLYFFVSATNFVNDPGMIPYIDQPPGFPLLLVPFIAIFRDPMVSAFVAQCVYLVLFYLFVYLMTVRLKFSALLKIVTLILFTFVGPFRYVHNFFWTETLFIALSIAACYFAVGLLTEAGRKRDWVSFIIVVALSSLVRYTGVANLVLIAPFLLKRDTPRAAWRLLTHKYTLACISVGGGLLIVLSLLANLLPNAKPGIGPMQWGGIGLGSAGLFVGLAGLLFLRKNDSQTHVPGPHSNKLDASTWALFAVLGTAAPVLAWIVRNVYLYHVISNWGLFQVSQFNRFAVPFQYIWDELLGFHFVPRLLAALLIAGLLFLPFSRLPIIGMSGSRRAAHILILGAAAAHFLLIWFLSIVTKNESISARYFSPVLAFLLLGMLNGLQQASQSVRPSIWRQSLLAAPLFFLALSTAFSPAGLFQSLGRINYPPERQLWSEIGKIDWTHSSSFFYSDEGYEAGGYIHQIFSGRPQGILWDINVIRNPERIKEILSHGVHPFMLVIENGPDARILDGIIASRAIPLDKLSFPDAGYVLYYLNN